MPSYIYIIYIKSSRKLPRWNERNMTQSTSSASDPRHHLSSLGFSQNKQMRLCMFQGSVLGKNYVIKTLEIHNGDIQYVHILLGCSYSTYNYPSSLPDEGSVIVQKMIPPQRNYRYGHITGQPQGHYGFSQSNSFSLPKHLSS